jgi:hypothetical protein
LSTGAAKRSPASTTTVAARMGTIRPKVPHLCIVSKLRLLFAGTYRVGFLGYLLTLQS